MIGKKTKRYVTGKATDDMHTMLYGQRFPKPGTKKHNSWPDLSI